MDLATGDASVVAKVNGEPIWPCVQVAVSADATKCYITTASKNSPAVLWQIDVELGRRRLASLSSGLGRIALGAQREIEWQMPDGRRLRGELILPPGYEEGKPVPTILEVYAGSVGRRRLRQLGTTAFMVNPYLLAAHGYAVLFPDIPLEGSNPYSQIPGPVLAAVQKVIDMGIADSERLGVMGQSYGGYTVFSLITQTDVFKAAVSNAGMVNLLTTYTRFAEQNGRDWTWYCETGQGRMCATPWERRGAYIRNSPFFYLNRVSTPILITCGDKDVLDSVGQAHEAFVGLRRLGKTVEMRIYENEGHGHQAWTSANYRDFCERVIEWFDAYLKS